MSLSKPRSILDLAIGDVGGEIGVGAVALLQRTVDVVAEIGRPEQPLLAILPVLGRLALGRGDAALKNEALLLQLLHRLNDGAGVVQALLREEDLVVDVEERQIVP